MARSAAVPPRAVRRNCWSSFASRDVRVPPFNDPRVRLAFDYAVDKPAIRQAMLKGRGGKRATWFNEEYERLFVEGRSTNDRAARLRAYIRMAEILHEENPSMFLFGFPSLYAVNRRVTGFGAASDKCLRLATTSVA